MQNWKSSATSRVLRDQSALVKVRPLAGHPCLRRRIESCGGSGKTILGIQRLRRDGILEFNHDGTVRKKLSPKANRFWRKFWFAVVTGVFWLRHLIAVGRLGSISAHKLDLIFSRIFVFGNIVHRIETLLGRHLVPRQLEEIQFWRSKQKFEIKYSISYLIKYWQFWIWSRFPMSIRLSRFLKQWLWKSYPKWNVFFLTSLKHDPMQDASATGPPALALYLRQNHALDFLNMMMTISNFWTKFGSSILTLIKCLMS